MRQLMGNQISLSALWVPRGLCAQNTSLFKSQSLLSLVAHAQIDVMLLAPQRIIRTGLDARLQKNLFHATIVTINYWVRSMREYGMSRLSAVQLAIHTGLSIY